MWPVMDTVSGPDRTAECPLVSEEMECVMPDITTIKTEHPGTSDTDDTGGAQNVAMGIKFILPNRFDMNVCSRFVKSLNEEDSKNIQDQVNSDLEVASVLFKGKLYLLKAGSSLNCSRYMFVVASCPKYANNMMLFVSTSSLS